MGRRQVKTKKTEAINGEDRINNLPNSLITHVLSCIPTKEAVKTSILSRRWRPLWASLPIMEFTDEDSIPSGDRLIDRTRKKANFSTFICRFLLQKNPSSIRKLHLKGSHCYDISQLESWLSLAKRRKVHELQLEIYYYQNGSEYLPFDNSRMSLFLSIYPLDPCIKCEKDRAFTNKLWLTTKSFYDDFVLEPWTTVVKEWNIEELKLDFTAAGHNMIEYEFPKTFPKTLFTCQMLKVLKLEGSDMVLDFALTSISFPNLKVLHLSRIIFHGSEWASNFINSGCPVLEELDINRHDEDNITNLIVTSRTLKRLTVTFYIPEPGTLNIYNARIDAPALEYLYIDDEFTKEYHLEDCPFVDVAYINVHYMLCSKALDLLNKICNVERLKLSEYTMSALQHSGYNDLPTFYLLSQLKMVSNFNEEPYIEVITWNFVLELLKKSPKLEMFLIKEILFDLGEDFMVTSDFDVPNCLKSQIKTIELGFVSFKDDELKVVGYLLKNCKVLQNLKIRIRGYSPEDKSVGISVFSLSKGSSECHIEISGWMIW